MPTIAPASPAVARRLDRAITTASLVPPASNIAVLTPNGGNVFEVGDALLAAYNLDVTNNPQAPAAPNCRANNPCYTSMCTDTLQTPRNTYEFPVSFSATVVVDGFDVTGTLNDGPPNATFNLHWGQGTVVPVQLDDDGNWSGSHTFAAAGSYTLELLDDDGVVVGSRTISVPSS